MLSPLDEAIALVAADEAAYEDQQRCEAMQRDDRLLARMSLDPDCVDFSAELLAERAVDAVASHVVTREEAEAARASYVPDIMPDFLTDSAEGSGEIPTSVKPSDLRQISLPVRPILSDRRARVWATKPNTKQGGGAA